MQHKSFQFKTNELVSIVFYCFNDKLKFIFVVLLALSSFINRKDELIYRYIVNQNHPALQAEKYDFYVETTNILYNVLENR